MKKTTFSDAVKIYDCCKNVHLLRHKVNHRELMEFCFALNKFVAALGYLAWDDFWKPFLRCLRRYRFTMYVAPLPFNHFLVLNDEQFSEPIKSCLSECGRIYPEMSERTREIARSYKSLCQSGENPLLDTISLICKSSQLVSSALLIKNSNLIPVVEEYLQENLSLSDLEIIVPAVLSGAAYYENLIVVGPAGWFPNFVFDSPRARNIHTVQYSWLKDTWKYELAFKGSVRASGPLPRFSYDRNKEKALTREAGTKELVDIVDLVPPIDLGFIVDRVKIGGNQADEFEEVEARPYVLEGGVLVFLESSKDARALVIDLQDYSEEGEDEESSYVKKIPVSVIEPGMFILLRTAGGGDYVVPVADMIMGEHAKQCRDMQSKWKNLLRKAVLSNGLSGVCEKMLDLGSVKANETNLRNWMSERNIRPRSNKDFEAILNVVGLGSQISKYRKTAMIIAAAHHKAGFQIRRRLLKQVLNSDLRILQKKGRMDFELPEAEGGTLTAFRVKEIKPETYRTQVSRIGRPIEMADEIWQE